MSSSKSSLIKGSGIGVQKGKNWLVHDVDIDIAPGEIVTLIGPNGAGKSTVAKMVTGVLKTSSGTLERAPNISIGYVPQKLNIDWTFPLSVERLLRLTRPHTNAEIIDALETTQVGHLVKSPVQQLSGGEFQRVLLARAMISKPNLLVLDEPVQGVDYTGQAQLYQLIADIRDRTGCGVLMVSHDLHIVMAQTDKVICLNGHICCSGTPKSVAKHPNFLELFAQNDNPTHAFYAHKIHNSHGTDGKICDHEHMGENHNHV